MPYNPCSCSDLYWETRQNTAVVNLKQKSWASTLSYLAFSCQFYVSGRLYRTGFKTHRNRASGLCLNEIKFGLHFLSRIIFTELVAMISEASPRSANSMLCEEIEGAEEGRLSFWGKDGFCLITKKTITEESPVLLTSQILWTMRN